MDRRGTTKRERLLKALQRLNWREWIDVKVIAREANMTTREAAHLLKSLGFERQRKVTWRGFIQKQSYQYRNIREISQISIRE